MLNKNKMPNTEPPAAGIQPISPAAFACSMAGMSNDHMLAAIITPAAKPRSVRWRCGEDGWRNKKTMLLPKDVRRKVKPVPTAAQINWLVTIRILSFKIYGENAGAFRYNAVYVQDGYKVKQRNRSKFLCFMVWLFGKRGGGRTNGTVSIFCADVI